MRVFLLIFPAVLLCQCGAPQPPSCHFLPSGSRAPAAGVMETAERNWKILADPNRKEQWPAAEAAYNGAVAILFDKLRCGPGDWTSRAAKLGTAISAPDTENQNLARIDSLFPASAVKVRSDYRIHQEQGLGIPAVGWKATSPVGMPRPAFHPPNGQPRNTTVTLDFSTSVPLWKFSKRWVKHTCDVEGIPHHLAADWTAPIDFFWYMCELDDLRIQNVLIPKRYTEETKLYFLEPYDPKKIPVVMVHGLVSSPDAYRHIINDLSPEPWFREHYQVWLYNYPTGTPWLYNAMRFRQIMGEAANFARSKGPDGNLKKMVVLSHSMGGLLTRAAITDPGKTLYNAHFKTPFEQLAVKPETRRLIREGLLYEPLTDPKRVVFMAVPHRGSPMANFRGTAFLSNLIRLPKTLTVGIVDATIHSARDNLEAGLVTTAEDIRPPTAISSLSPNSRGFKAFNQLPMSNRIAFHSIVGDKGHGDTPHSSDGVVPYWSSHIEPVESELIVPSNHSVPDRHDTSREISRILFLHLKKENMLRPSDFDKPPSRTKHPLKP